MDLMAYISDKDLNTMAEKASQAQAIISKMKQLTDFAQAIEGKAKNEDATLAIAVGVSGKNDGALNDADADQNFDGDLFINLSDAIKTAVEAYQEKLHDELLALKDAQTQPDQPAVKQITITFNANGGTGTAPEPITGDQNSQVALPENTFTAPDGKVFLRWSSNAQGNGGHGGVAGDNVTLDTADSFTMYAIWGTK